MHLILSFSLDAGLTDHDLGDISAFTRCRIGRGDDADLCVHQLSVSRLHCELAKKDGSIILRDLGSSSGTFVNGDDVSGSVVLENGDVIRIGDTDIRVRFAKASVLSGDQAVASEAQTVLTSPWFRSAQSESVPFTTSSGSSDEPAGTLLASQSLSEPGATARLEIPLSDRSLTVGRDADCDIVIQDQLLISRRHAQFSPERNSWAVRDLGSSNGTFVNGSRIRKPTPLVVGDIVTVGPFQLQFTGQSLVNEEEDHGPGIDVQGLSMPKREGGFILQDVSFRIEPGQLIGLIGMSGSGKSRLMHAMCGRAAFSGGRVLYNGRDLVSQFEAVKSSIGYVPSRLMLHEPLTVREALSATSRLRLATDTTEEESNRNINEILEMLSIAHRSGSRISTLSDGEKRRLGLAVELLAKPPVLLLDEVTTALDLPLHCRLMRLFRDLADRGQSLVLISHHIEDLELCDKWLYIIQGQVAFFGTPNEYCQHFGVASLREQLDQQDTKTSEEWAEMFLQAGVKNVGAAPELLHAEPQPEVAARKARWGEIRRQIPLLSGRFVRLIASDRSSLKLVAMLAPLIASVIILLNIALEKAVENSKEALGAIEFPNAALTAVNWADAVVSAKSQQSVIVYMLTISTIVIASFLAVREIVKETEIYSHERFAGMEILPYLLSKLVVLGSIGVAATLCVSMVTTLFVGEEGISAPFVPLFLLLASLSIASTAMGLLISAAAKSSEQAVFVLVPVLIMQLALCGAFPLDASAGVMWLARVSIMNYWTYNGILDLLDPVNIKPNIDEAFGKFSGEPYLLAVVMQFVHATVYFFAAYIILLWKDGPGLVDRVRREIKTLIPPPRIPRGSAPSAGVGG